MEISVNQEKYAEEIKFWTEELDRYVIWYRGGMKEFYGVPAPRECEKISYHADVRMNALETWINADKWRYCKHLFVEPTYFSGRNVLEIGPGPLGLSRFFAGARVWGVDPLLDAYDLAGYPTTRHGIVYVESRAENMRIFNNGEFDAAISVNAIDHVDDFAKAISEVERVVRSDGEIRIEVHYHAPTVTEPNVLNDDIVRSAFGMFNIKKISEVPSSYFYPEGTHPSSDRFALWATNNYLFDAKGALR